MKCLFRSNHDINNTHPVDYGKLHKVSLTYLKGENGALAFYILILKFFKDSISMLSQSSVAHHHQLLITSTRSFMF